MVTFSNLNEEVESLRVELGEYRTTAATKEQDLWTRVEETQSLNVELKATINLLEDELKKMRDVVEVRRPLAFRNLMEGSCRIVSAKASHRTGVTEDGV